MRPLVLVIGGGSASGKTTLARAFASRTGALLLSHDRYYRDYAEPTEVNFDHPDALETSLLVEHLDALLRGEAVSVPVYDFGTHQRQPLAEHLHPCPVIVVEGILALADPDLVARCDLSVYVACPDDVRLLRRMLRDCVERDRSVVSVAAQYMGTVRPMHEQFVAPCEARAMLVLDGMKSTAIEVERLVAASASRRP